MNLSTSESRVRVIIESVKSNRNKQIRLNNLNLRAVPDEIFDMTWLTSVDLSDNDIEILPAKLFSLVNLSSLWLSNNKIKQIPPEISRLRNLVSLSLNGNELEQLPEEFCELRQLMHLHLQNNKINRLPKSICDLSNLETLWLQFNHLKYLSKDFLQIANKLLREDKNAQGISSLKIENNDFRIPKELFNQDLSTIITYIISFQETEPAPLNEIKMILLGDAYAGKSSLVEQIVHGTFRKFGDTEVTRGIRITKWDTWTNRNPRPITVNIWDFGGQEVMHAMHQFFMTERSIYILVWNARSDDPEDRMEDWIKLIKTFGGESPIFVVINKTDDGNFIANEEYLRSEYNSNIRGFVRTSCSLSRNGSHGIDQLKNSVIDEIEKHLADTIPLPWFNVKKALENRQENYINLSEYYKICEQNGVTNDMLRHSLLRLLHDLGVAFNYGDKNNPQSTNILKPQWVTKAIYDIINSNRLSEKNGTINTDDLEDILAPKTDYPKEKHNVIMGLMQKFDLCFSVTSNEYLIPDLLSKNQPYIADDFKDSLQLQFHYDYLPKSIFPRFVVKVHELSRPGCYWQSGIIIEDNHAIPCNKALILVDQKEKTIFIKVNGANDTRRKLLNKIRNTLDIIHDGIPNLHPVIYVPFNRDPKIIESYDYLLTLERNGFNKFVPRGLDFEVPISDFLRDVKREKDITQKEDPKTLISIMAQKKASLERITQKVNICDHNAKKYAEPKRIIEWSAVAFLVLIIAYPTINYWTEIEPWLTVLLILIPIIAAAFFLNPNDRYHKRFDRKRKELYSLAEIDPLEIIELQRIIANIKSKLIRLNVIVEDSYKS